MKIWFKSIFYSLLLLFVLAVAINFHYFYANFKFAVFGKPAVLDERFRKAVSGEQAVMDKNYLLIPSLGIQAPVVYTSEKSDQAFSVALKDGVVHYPGTALPGERGNCYIFGHSSDYPWKAGNYKTVLALLPKIAVGAEVLVSDPSGAIFRYRVNKTLVAGPDEAGLLNQYNYQKQILTLQTSYPIGTALKRFIVQAELAK